MAHIVGLNTLSMRYEPRRVSRNIKKLLPGLHGIIEYVSRKIYGKRLNELTYNEFLNVLKKAFDEPGATLLLKTILD
ncbi:MAG: hypothetical protein DRO40_01660 [Thermoprotei archaeon]|nr:MAG: hypothetical protein DRO40_01660 [Thermoprotei archaeon]